MVEPQSTTEELAPRNFLFRTTLSGFHGIENSWCFFSLGLCVVVGPVLYETAFFGAGFFVQRRFIEANSSGTTNSLPGDLSRQTRREQQIPSQAIYRGKLVGNNKLNFPSQAIYRGKLVGSCGDLPPELPDFWYRYRQQKTQRLQDDLRALGELRKRCQRLLRDREVAPSRSRHPEAAPLAQGSRSPATGPGAALLAPLTLDQL